MRPRASCLGARKPHAELQRFNTGGTAEFADNFVPVDEHLVGFLIQERHHPALTGRILMKGAINELAR
jgi:hypothetical protein